MSQARGRIVPRPDEDAATAGARERAEAALDGFNRLSPDELARVGLSRRDPAARAELVQLEAMLALLVGGAFALLVLFRSRRAIARTPIDDA